MARKKNPKSAADGVAHADPGPLAGLLGPTTAVEPPEAPFRNFDRGDPDARPRERTPLRARAIWEDLAARTGGWPRAVAGKLFVAGPGLRPRYLRNASQLFAHIDGVAPVEWAEAADLVTQVRFYEYARAAAES